MKKLDELLNFIKNNPPADEIWYTSDWEKELTEKIPDWKNLIRDENNWDKIKEVKARRKDYLWKCFIDVVGIDLLNYCLDSNDDDLHEAAKGWLNSKFIVKLDHIYPSFINLWEKLHKRGKKYVIDGTFEQYPGEPFRYYKLYKEYLHEYDEKGYRDSITNIYINFPPIKYIPSREVLNLRDIIEKSDDEYSLEMINKKIDERKRAFEFLTSINSSLRVLYYLNAEEKELIANAIDKFRRNGYSTAALPEIYLSYETPPLFVAYPELEEELEDEEVKRIRKAISANNSSEGQEDHIIPRNRQRGIPEIITIEEVLGCYIPNPKIILYTRGITWFAKRYNIEENLLRMIVLVHEIGHWITHLLPTDGAPSWPTELFIGTSEEVKEGWAQLITYWVVDEIGGKIKNVFEKLNNHQSSAYRVYESFKGEKIDEVISSLYILRMFNRPAKLNDWKKIMKIS